MRSLWLQVMHSPLETAVLIEWLIRLAYGVHRLIFPSVRGVVWPGTNLLDPSVVVEELQSLKRRVAFACVLARGFLLSCATIHYAEVGRSIICQGSFGFFCVRALALPWIHHKGHAGQHGSS